MRIPSSIAAIIFDLDGTLVNTEPVHCRAWLQVLAQRGYHYDEHWFEQWIGTADRFLAEGVIKDHQLSIPARVLQDEKQTLFHDIVVAEAQLFAGVAPALALLQQRLPLAIATNSGRADAEHVFVPTQLNVFMQAVVTADDVPRLKPAPDMYLLAAKHLNVAPATCLVVEDSPAGSQAARDAGMYVLGLTSSQGAEKMTAAHELFPSPGAAMKRLIEITA